VTKMMAYVSGRELRYLGVRQSSAEPEDRQAD
jgi:hypothetical protein